MSTTVQTTGPRNVKEKKVKPKTHFTDKMGLSINVQKKFNIKFKGVLDPAKARYTTLTEYN